MPPPHAAKRKDGKLILFYLSLRIGHSEKVLIIITILIVLYLYIITLISMWICYKRQWSNINGNSNI